jgi:hypothetical protein
MNQELELPGFRGLESGVLKDFLITADSGREKTCAFCSECGVRIYNTTSALMAVTAGTLDNTSWLNPDAPYWTKKRQSWVPLPDDIPCFKEFE